jgi:hypothetical protein
MRTRLSFALLAAALVGPLFAVPAYAQRARTFVASYGTDSATCGAFLSPCRNFQQAVNNVAVDGEVTAIDSAGFGPISINKSVTITSPNGVEAGVVPAPGGVAITITATPFVAVILHGLTINGYNSGSSGIVFTAGASLTVEDCIIRNMTGDGIEFFPYLTSTHSLSISNTIVSNNGGNGILVKPSASASVVATFDHVKTQYNGANGLELSTASTTANIRGTATDAVSSDNNGDGFLAEGGGGGASLIVVRSVAANNHSGLVADLPGAGATGAILISQTTIINNMVACSGFVNSTGDNIVAANFDPTSVCTGSPVQKQ